MLKSADEMFGFDLPDSFHLVQKHTLVLRGKSYTYIYILSPTIFNFILQ